MQVDSDHLDAAVMIKPRLGIPSDSKWVTLMKERYVGIAPTGSPRTLKELFSALPFNPLGSGAKKWWGVLQRRVTHETRNDAARADNGGPSFQSCRVHESIRWRSSDPR
jgi:hypothetical protein